MIGDSRTSRTPDAARSQAAPADLTGRSRMARNVLASWAGHFVFIVAGFILPRVIDGRLGPSALGVWDFSWALVAYFGLVQGGIVSSVNRYVAKCRATGDIEGVNRVASSVTLLLAIAATVVVLVTVAATLAMPRLLTAQLGEHMRQARWVVGLLGASLAIQVAFSAFGGVLTGCHRWDLHNAIHAGSYAATVAAMIVALAFGYGLRSLAAASLAGEVVGRLVRVLVAYRVCPGLSVCLAHVDWPTMRRMLTFGGKSSVPTVANLILNQTTSILIVGYLGPATLALYARPMALIRHLQTLVIKYAFVFTPTASSLQALEDRDQLRELLILATRYAACLTLPAVAFLTIFGGPLLVLWMGPDYAQPKLLAILALGFASAIIAQPIISVLVGLNAHGWPGLANLLAAVCAVGAVLVVLGVFHGGLIGAAAAVVIPLMLANAIFVPIYACRRVGLSISSFARRALGEPFLYVIPFVVCLIGVRVAFKLTPLGQLVTAALLGTASLAPIYWMGVVPPTLKARIIGRFRWARRQPVASDS